MNCWPGCLARVIAKTSNGAWVRCIRIRGDVKTSSGAPAWEVECLSVTKAWKRSTQELGTSIPGDRGVCSDADLRPISPDEFLESDFTDTVTEEEFKRFVEAFYS